jgi:DNA-binding MarR family transcriptional regulator
MQYDPRVEGDAVDAKLEALGRELPQIHLPTEGIVQRIQRLAWRLNRSLNETAAAYGLTHADWGLLGSLRAAGAPFRQPAGKLADHLSITAGAMTSRLDRLEARGLVRRIPDPDDRRVLQIELTEEGDRLWTEAVGVQAEKERLIASALDEDEQERLNALLRKLMLAFGAVPGAKKKAD